MKNGKVYKWCVIMIEYLESPDLLNKYAFVTNPSPEEEHELEAKGYQYFSSSKITETETNKKIIKEVWIK